MSSGQHLTKEMYDLIKSIGETRSKQEEDKIITTELNSLKTKIKEKNLSSKKQKENLIRAIYIEMLGHDASFGYIEAVNMTQSKVFSLKRMGYLASCLFFHENSEYLLLLVATIQKDLASNNINEMCVALNTVSKLVSSGIVHALVDPIINLLTHNNELIRKKAILCIQKISAISSSLVSSYPDKMKRALCDKDPSVMGAVLHSYYAEIKKNPTPFKDLTGSFVVILKQIIEHKLARDYDYHRMPAPWIQIRILQVLAMLGSNDQKVSEQIYEILSQTLRRADDTGINIGYAVTYQCVKTISTIYPNQNLLETAGKSIARFLTSENNNLKYLGINALIPIVQINPKYSLEHQMTVVDCLESHDETLKRETLLLLYKMTNGNNVDVICEKLLHYLKMASDPHFKKDLVNKIMQLSERFAPTQEWFIETMNILFEFGSEFISEEILTNVLKLIDESFRMNPQEVGDYLINTYYEIICSKENLPDVVLKVVAWVFGEIGSELYSQEPEKLEELGNILQKSLSAHYEDDLTKGWIINALSKLSSCPKFPSAPAITEIASNYSRSKICDLYQRALEYKKLVKFRWALKQSSQLVVDSSLNFLAAFVQKAKEKGAKVYEPKKTVQGWLTSLNIDSKDVAPAGIIYQAYEKQDKSGGGGGSSGKTDEENQNALKVSGPRKWGNKGYAEDDPVNKPVTMQTNDKITQSISSSSFEVKTKSKAAANSGTGGGYKMPGIQSISSDNYNVSGGTSTSYKPDSKNDSKTTTFSKPAVPVKEDPASLEKQKLASAIFAMGTTNTKPAGLFGVMNVKNTSSSTSKLGSSSLNKPAAMGNKPKENIDLLDLDDDFSKPPENIAKNNDLNLLMGMQKEEPQGQINVSMGAANTNVKPNLFANLTSKKQQPAATPLNKLTQKFEVDQFEKYWETMPEELIEKFQSKIHNESEFKMLTESLGINIIEIIDNEIVCAGLNERKEIILVYGIYEASGNMEVRIKAKTPEEMARIMKVIKLYAL